MKTCNSCGVEKEDTCFSQKASAKDLLHPYCRSCDSRRRATNRDRMERVPVDSKRCRLCKQTVPAAQFSPSRSTTDGLATYCKPCAVAHTTARRYGMKIEERAEFIKTGCAICGSHENLHIDHDHTCCPERSCGKCIRGVLCAGCNHGLGKFRDRPELLEAAADYLRSDFRWVPPEYSCDECGNPCPRNRTTYCSVECARDGQRERRRQQLFLSGGTKRSQVRDFILSCPLPYLTVKDIHSALPHISVGTIGSVLTDLKDSGQADNPGHKTSSIWYINS